MNWPHDLLSCSHNNIQSQQWGGPPANMPGINSVEYPVQGNKCRLVVGKSDFKEGLKHMIYTTYQSMVCTDDNNNNNNNNNPNTMSSSSKSSHMDHNNSMVGSSLHSNTSVLFISPCMIPMVTFVKEECWGCVIVRLLCISLFNLATNVEWQLVKVIVRLLCISLFNLATKVEW